MNNIKWKSFYEMDLTKSEYVYECIDHLFDYKVITSEEKTSLKNHYFKLYQFSSQNSSLIKELHIKSKNDELSKFLEGKAVDQKIEESFMQVLTILQNTLGNMDS